MKTNPKASRLVLFHNISIEKNLSEFPLRKGGNPPETLKKEHGIKIPQEESLNERDALVQALFLGYFYSMLGLEH